MNTYYKYYPNVFLAKCEQKHEKGETINVTTKYGKENECIVFNLIFEKDGFYYYSIVRADGFDSQEYARRKAERYNNAKINAETKSEQQFNKSDKIISVIPPGQPILVGHHSEKRHRRDLAKSDNAMRKGFEEAEKAEKYERKADYWEGKAESINLSMPDCIEYFENELENAKQRHADLKNIPELRKHSYSLIYAKKEVNETAKKLELAIKLWS